MILKNKDRILVLYLERIWKLDIFFNNNSERDDFEIWKIVGMYNGVFVKFGFVGTRDIKIP